MKYNTTEFSGDALREAASKYNPASPAATDAPDPAVPGRHAATRADERQPDAPQSEQDEHDHNTNNGAPVDKGDPADRTAPVTPKIEGAADDADEDLATADHAHATPPTPPAPVEIDTPDGLLTGPRFDAHAAMEPAQTLDPPAGPRPEIPAAAPSFLPPQAPPAPTPDAPLPAAASTTAYRPRPAQRAPEAWDPADEPTSLGIVIPTPPSWAELPPQPQQRPTAPEARTNTRAVPDLTSRGPALPQQAPPAPQGQPSTPQQFGPAAPQFGGPPQPQRPTQDWSNAQQPRQPQWPTNQPQPTRPDPRQSAPYNNYGGQQPAPQQQWTQHPNPEVTDHYQQPASTPAPLPSPPPPPAALRSEATDRAFSLQSQRKEGPTQGWRGALNRIHIPVRKSAAELAYDKDIASINRTFRYSKTVGIAAFKGGVGKTTCALCLASTVSEHRTKGEVAAVDTDDRGSLARRVHGDQTSDIKRFAYDKDLQTPNEVKSHMMSNAHRLSVLGSSHSPLANALSPAEYLRTQQILQNNHLFVFVDMDTSAASPAYETVMHSLDALVLVTSTSIDSAEAGRSMRDWLRARELNDLAAHTLVLINHQSPAKPFLDLDSTASYYRNNEKCPVLEIPWDPHLAEASSVNLDLLDKGTRRQFVKAAATLVDMLPQS